MASSLFLPQKKDYAKNRVTRVAANKQAYQAYVVDSQNGAKTLRRKNSNDFSSLGKPHEKLSRISSKRSMLYQCFPTGPKKTTKIPTKKTAVLAFGPPHLLHNTEPLTLMVNLKGPSSCLQTFIPSGKLT